MRKIRLVPPPPLKGHSVADQEPDPALYLIADPDTDPESQTNADPGQTVKSQKGEFLHENIFKEGNRSKITHAKVQKTF